MGERVNHNRVARVTRENSIAGFPKRSRVRITMHEPSGHKVPDLLNRDFTAAAPGSAASGRHLLPLADGMRV